MMNNEVAETTADEMVVLRKPERKILTELEIYEYMPTERIRALMNSGMLQTTLPQSSKWRSLWENEELQLNKYRKMLNKGLVKTTYKTPPYSNYGRVFAKDQMSLSCMRRVARNTLTHDLYYDIDMKCCHVSILISLLEKTDFPRGNYENWLYYFHNRDDVHSRWSQRYGGDTAWKMFATSLLYYGNHNEAKKDDFASKLALEVKSIVEYLKSRNKTFYDHVRRQKTDNHDGGFLARYLMEHEYRILEEVISYLYYETNYLKFNKMSVLSYEYDGFKALIQTVGGEKGLERMLKEINDLIQKKYNHVVFVSKPMTDKLDIPPSPHNAGDMALYEKQADLSDVDCLDILEESVGQNIIWDDCHWYYFDGSRWLKYDKVPHKLKDSMGRIIDDYFHKHVPETEVITWDKYNANKVMLGSNKKCREVIDACKSRFYKNTDGLFDRNEYLFGFENGVYDLKHDEFRPYRYDDFVTMSSRLHYTERDETKIEFLRGFFKKIHPDDDNRDLMLTLRASACCGKNVDRFVLLNGKGRNGKGTEDELQHFALGDYSYHAEPTLLTKALNPSGADPIVALTHLKRCIIVKEPQAYDKLQNGTIKSFTGGGEMAFRLLYSNNPKVVQHMTLFMECNERPLLACKPMVAEMERWVDLEYVSFFGDIPEDDPDNNRYKKDNRFRDDQFKRDYAMPFLHILFDYFKRWREDNYVFHVPQHLKDRAMAYLRECNPVHDLFNKLYEHNPRAPKIPVREVYLSLANCEEYRVLSPYQKKQIQVESIRNYLIEMGYTITEKKKGCPIVEGIGKQHNTYATATEAPMLLDEE